LKVSKLFAQQGASLVLTDFNSDFKNVLNEVSSVDNNFKKDHLTHVCDVRSSKDVNVLFQAIKDKYRTSANIVVNSAGVATENLFINISEEEFDRTLDTNLKGSFLVTQAAIRELVNNHKNVKLQSDDTYGSIINMGSINGKLGASGYAHYAASKSGLEGLTKTVAREYGKYLIRTNTVLPGMVDTPMIAKETRQKYIIAATPLGRLCKAEDVAKLCLFLASNDSSFINGASIDINGGLSF
jgi:NAD(P)-dependent dehydrogenase (short-subunit alcohol dehydrogenase family)